MLIVLNSKKSLAEEMILIGLIPSINVKSNDSPKSKSIVVKAETIPLTAVCEKIADTVMIKKAKTR